MAEIANTMYSWGQSQNTEGITSAAFLAYPLLSVRVFNILCHKSKSKQKRDQPLPKMKPDFKLVLIKTF